MDDKEKAKHRFIIVDLAHDEFGNWVEYPLGDQGVEGDDACLDGFFKVVGSGSSPEVALHNVE